LPDAFVKVAAPVATVAVAWWIWRSAAAGTGPARRVLFFPL